MENILKQEYMRVLARRSKCWPTSPEGLILHAYGSTGEGRGDGVIYVKAKIFDDEAEQITPPVIALTGPAVDKATWQEPPEDEVWRERVRELVYRVIGGDLSGIDEMKIVPDDYGYSFGTFIQVLKPASVTETKPPTTVWRY